MTFFSQLVSANDAEANSFVIQTMDYSQRKTLVFSTRGDGGRYSVMVDSSKASGGQPPAPL